ncbi:acyl-CoA N-acyltransferase [Aspergillus sclerotioniger CBS 115572]|uniref:Acyl-CoA N-acyltransferase n=1 Tax=Aspergillus sclerotioniger CBS 115572 TaxID=1450535 RepID=A0A317XDG9_9EURO|nr:acyl-CoA N-acyltransferase [Aspergillus sclerotioniger CBS 115572]PWY94580.1 acyl-CoA N-acyltransferase [Aspergillus sclerotioniger CBS 115572]
MPLRPTIPKARILQTRLISSPSPPKPTPASRHHDLHLLPASPSDSPAIADVFLHSFSDPFNRRMFPLTEDVRRWWVDQFRRDIEQSCAANPSSAFLKVTAADGAIAAFAKWRFPVPPTPEDKHKTAWPPSSDADLCEQFFQGMDSERTRIMGEKEYFYLDLLGTRPEFNGKGIGSRLLRWGLERADAAGVDTFLSSTPQGRRLYERYGFRMVHEYEVVPGYIQASMVRVTE